MSLELLPTELQWQIIRYLDPISFISINQTSSHFRRLFTPEKKHFTERLLALELTPKHGGPHLLFRSRDSSLKPEWSDPEWEKMRWACTGCSRLLSHKHFDNHSILRLGYRKPRPGSIAADMVTTWDPTRYTRPRSTDAKQSKRDAEVARLEEKRRRRRYFISVTSGKAKLGRKLPMEDLDMLQDCGMEGFEGMGYDAFERMTPEEITALFDKNALSIEDLECGKKRHLRKCNECRFQRNELWHQRPCSQGSRRLPMMKSRRAVFGTHRDRYFPRFWDHLDHKRPLFNLPLGLHMRVDAREQAWTMYMVRCPGCQSWQELREFRLTGLLHDWVPFKGSKTWDGELITEALVNTRQCNSCFAEAHGRHELARVLSRWLLRIMGEELKRLTATLLNGFRNLELSAPQRLCKKYTLAWKSMRQTTTHLRHSWGYVLKDDEIAALKLVRDQWWNSWRRVEIDNDDLEATEHMNRRFKEWASSFDEIEEHLLWLKACQTQLEEQPERLAEWALSRDRASLA
ncbi:hypothetical protein F66182_7230 [Fusarium sp. NRRL 66182]|nr:hypothetical protein F66182_7230 [Fusarium sp. NRRL 66182]